MSSVQDVVNSAHRINESALQLRMMLQEASGRLKSSIGRLSTLSRGSRSATEALKQVQVAHAALTEAIRQMSSLEHSVNDFMTDVQK